MYVRKVQLSQLKEHLAADLQPDVFRIDARKLLTCPFLWRVRNTVFTYSANKRKKYSQTVTVVSVWYVFHSAAESQIYMWPDEFQFKLLSCHLKSLLYFSNHSKIWLDLCNDLLLAILPVWFPQTTKIHQRILESGHLLLLWPFEWQYPLSKKCSMKEKWGSESIDKVWTGAGEADDGKWWETRLKHMWEWWRVEKKQLDADRYTFIQTSHL